MSRTFVKLWSIPLLLLALHYLDKACAKPTESLHFLVPGDSIENVKSGLRIFCHNAESKYLMRIWRSLTMNLNTSLDVYDLYDGKTPEEVQAKHEDNQRSWRFNLFGYKKEKQLKINPFEDSCIGVHTSSSKEYEYTMSMTQSPVDIWKLSTMILGIIMFRSAQRLSRNPLFYYLCGITLGVMTSIVILVYLMSKLLPKGKLMYAMVATGWTMSIYIGQALWGNAQVIVVQYRDYVMWYILTTSLVSFIICYRFGPVTNMRTIKIIQWFLQVLGLIAIYYSSYFHEASIACCIVLILLYNFPTVAIQRGKRYWKNMFPDRRKLLTEDQYRKEGIRETSKALKELQEYCSSPECNPWKTVLKLKDPIRFAKFMEGDTHLSEDETLEHDAEITRIIEEYEYTDDDDF
ncbi:hypothetical protein KM043_006330 [Ampulex compressa]|nr:hypothetical protein KM043_006330 [Ampulex compressa]